MKPIGMIPCFLAALKTRLRARSRAASSSKATWLNRARALRTCAASWIGRRRRPRESMYANALSGSRAPSSARRRDTPACSHLARAQLLADEARDLGPVGWGLRRAHPGADDGTDR